VRTRDSNLYISIKGIIPLDKSKFYMLHIRVVQIWVMLEKLMSRRFIPCSEL